MTPRPSSRPLSAVEPARTRQDQGRRLRLPTQARTTAWISPPSGSSGEHAPIAIKASGVSCVIAKSFARIFYRNAINIGLPILECPEAMDAIRSGDEVEVDTASGKITDLSTGQTFQARRFPEFLQNLIAAGGLIAYARERVKNCSS